MTSVPENSTPLRRNPFRVSLLQLFIVVTIAALVISHVLTSRRAARVEAELWQMRYTFGYPVVTDKNAVAVGRVDMGNAGFQRFRVYKPPGTSLMVHCAVRGIETLSLPITDEKTPLYLPHDEPGECFIDVAVTEKAGKYELQIACRGVPYTSIIRELPKEHPLVQRNFIEARPAQLHAGDVYGIDGEAGKPTKWSSPSSERVHLLFAYARWHDRNYVRIDDHELGPGAAVWLEEVPAHPHLRSHGGSTTK